MTSYEYGLYNTVSFAIKLTKAIEQYQNSYGFRERFTRNLNQIEHNGDAYVISKVLEKTLKESEVSDQNRTVNFLFGDETFDMKSFIQGYSYLYNPLIISCKSKPTPANLPSFLESFNKHLNYFGLQDKTLVAVGFPRNVQDIKCLKQLSVKPNKVVLLKCKRSQDCTPNFLNDLKMYNSSVLQELHAEPLIDLCKNVRMILELGDPVLNQCKWHLRACIIGPQGAGVRLQARLLATNFDADEVIEKWKTKSEWFEYELDKNYLHSAIICERLMQKDCLYQGFVLIGFPKNLRQLQYFNAMPIAPNKIIFLKACKNTCMNRKRKQLLAESLQEDQMDIVMRNVEYSLTETLQKMREMEKYCVGMKEMVTINANRSIQTVTNYLSLHVLHTKNM